MFGEADASGRGVESASGSLGLFGEGGGGVLGGGSGGVVLDSMMGQHRSPQSKASDYPPPYI